MTIDVTSITHNATVRVHMGAMTTDELQREIMRHASALIGEKEHAEIEKQQDTKAHH